jgi:glycosyltransferase involved in cell wall biosynthesis
MAMEASSPRLVSTIIPVYNRPDLLQEAVASVLAQSHRPIEVIVVDDGSTDGTPAVCAALERAEAQMVRSVRIPHAGPGPAREAGRSLARGAYIQYLDSDDLLHPLKFERQVAALETHPATGVAYCKTREYALGTPAVDIAVARTGECLDALFPHLLSGRCWYTPSPLFRRAVCDAVGPWLSLGQEEDWEYDARLGALGTALVWCPEFLADVRHHEGARAGGSSQRDPAKMRWRARAHVLIYEHARRFGVGSDSVHMQRYARELFLLSRQCGAVGLPTESRALFELARQASGQPRAHGLDFRCYRLMAAVLGWSTTGRLACWSDRFRPGAAR